MYLSPRPAREQSSFDTHPLKGLEAKPLSAIVLKSSEQIII